MQRVRENNGILCLSANTKATKVRTSKKMNIRVAQHKGNKRL